jgi:phosphohistidine phosphatase
MISIVHHAAAVRSEIDPQRPLTAEGRAHAETMAQSAAARGVKPAAIWHSGKLRARQTAEPFWRLCNPLAEFAAHRGLQPDDPPEWIRDVLNAETRDVMLVGHLPHLPRVFQLLTGSAEEFPLHGLVALAREGESWRELWRIL